MTEHGNRGDEKLRAKAEGMARKGPVDTASMPREDIERLVQELEVYQIELQIQNEELRQIQESLQEARDRYVDLYDFSPSGYITLNSRNNSIIEINLSACDMLGIERATLVNTPFTRYLSPESEEAFYFCRRAAMSSDGQQSCEIALRRADGSTFWAELEVVFLHGKQQLRMAVIDIDERKKLEQEEHEYLQRLERSENALRKARQEAEHERDRIVNVLDSMQDGVYIVNAKREVEYANPAFRALFGEPGNRKCYSYVHGREEVCPGCHLEEVLSGRTMRYEVCNERLERTFDLVSTPLVNRDGSISLMTVFRDITAQKQAERKIRQQAALVNDINRILSKYLSGRSEEEIGRSCLKAAEELTGSRFSIIDMLGPDGLLHNLTVGDAAWEACAMIDKSGHEVAEGKFSVQGLCGYVASTGEPLLTNEPDKHPVGIGLPQGHVALTGFLGVPLKYHGVTIGVLGMANKEGTYTADDLEHALALAPTIIEVIMRKRLEAALRESEEYARQKADDLDTLMNTAPVAIWTALDPECRIVSGNEAANRLLETRPGQNISVVTLKEDNVEARPRFFRKGRELEPAELPMHIAIRTRREVRNAEMEMRTPTGKEVILLGSARPLFDSRGKVRGAVGTFMDITRRKKAERKIADLLEERSKKLEQSEESYQLLLQTMTEGVLVLDSANNIKFANPAAEAVFDLSHKNLAGQQFGLLVSEGVFEIEVPAGDDTRVLEVNTVPFHLDGEQGRLITLRDITQQKHSRQKIEELSQRVVEAQEKERRFIGHELHDEVGGALTAIKLAVSRTEKRLGESCGEELKKVKDLLDDTMDMVSALSQNMRPDILDEFGLLEALKWYFERYTAQTGICVQFRQNFDEERFPGIAEITAYRVVQESLTNAARYAETDKVTVTVNKDENILFIQVEDAGRGFDPTEVDMGGITGMQDRAMVAGGQVWVDSCPGNGTCVICELPLKE